MWQCSILSASLGSLRRDLELCKCSDMLGVFVYFLGMQLPFPNVKWVGPYQEVHTAWDLAFCKGSAERRKTGTLPKTNIAPDVLAPWKSGFLYQPVVFRVHSQIMNCYTGWIKGNPSGWMSKPLTVSVENIRKYTNRADLSTDTYMTLAQNRQNRIIYT